jgi:hypothetical protein
MQTTFDKTMDSIGKELGSLQGSVSLLPKREELDEKIATLPSRKELAAESNRVIDAFKKESKRFIDTVNRKIGVEAKGIVAAVSDTRDALTHVVDDSISKVNARLDIMATKDELNVLSSKIDGMDKKIDKLLGKSK